MLARFVADRRANVALIAALTLPVMLFAGGIGADYTFAGRRQVQLDGIADAAALTAVTQTLMAQSTSTAQYYAYNMFTSQAAKVSGISFSPTNLSVVVTDTNVNNQLKRQVTVSYSATSSNNFSGIIGLPTLKISGKAAAMSANALNIDFYLLLDTSPSMLIAATPTAINQMMALTPLQDGVNGCAFACHQSATFPSNFGGVDNYAIARNPCLVFPANSTSSSLCGHPNPYYSCFPLSICPANTPIPLRFDYVIAATAGNGGLMDTAATTEASNHAVYRMATYTFDYSLNQITSLTTDLNSSASNSAKSGISKASPLLVYTQGLLTQTNTNNDGDTDFDDAMSGMLNAMPTPGTGTTGNTPQEILFIVSDGLIDEDITAQGGGTYNATARFMAAVDTYQQRCTAIKNKGIRIAFLYTTYNPIPTNGFYNQYISPFQSQIGPTYAQKCASPGLYTEVTASGDITSALNNLFSKATSTAHLTQ